MKKILSLVLAVLMLTASVALLASCKKDENVLVMATEPSFPPYEFVGDDGNFAGIDVEIAQLIAEKLGMTLKIEAVEFGSIIGGVQSGKYDMGMAGMTVTPERLENVNFTTSYANGVQVVIVNENCEYADLDDFFVLDAEGNWTAVKEGVKIGVQQDTTGDIYASSKVEDFGFGEENVIRYKTGADAVQALKTGKVTAVIIDVDPAKSFVSVNEGLKIMPTEYANENYAICIAKENTELLEKINKVLEELIADGTVQQIIDKYVQK